MIRRPITVLAITAEDLADYEDRKEQAEADKDEEMRAFEVAQAQAQAQRQWRPAGHPSVMVGARTTDTVSFGGSSGEEPDEGEVEEDVDDENEEFDDEENEAQGQAVSNLHVAQARAMAAARMREARLPEATRRLAREGAPRMHHASAVMAGSDDLDDFNGDMDVDMDGAGEGGAGVGMTPTAIAPPSQVPPAAPSRTARGAPGRIMHVPRQGQPLTRGGLSRGQGGGGSSASGRRH